MCSDLARLVVRNVRVRSPSSALAVLLAMLTLNHHPDRTLSITGAGPLSHRPLRPWRLSVSSPACSGSCAAGYACPVGSNRRDPPATACPAGRFSVGGAGVCTICPGGVYGNGTGLTTPQCSGACGAGYVCPAGSIRSAPCPAGTYSLEGAANCTLCPAGTYGSGQGLGAPTCSGLCAAGSYCPPGSTNSSNNTCAPGRYSDPGAGSCSPCPLSSPYSQRGSSACVTCRGASSGMCASGGYGFVATAASPCPDPTWSVWYDTGRTEGTLSCWKLFGQPANWAAANGNCSAVGPGTHLLSAKQVCSCVGFGGRAIAANINRTLCISEVSNGSPRTVTGPACVSLLRP
jgi:hypothetical protein